MSGSTERITNINDSDVICGRGSLALKHPGNLAYRKLVKQNKELYATCIKCEKVRISKSIVAIMRETGCRFLEREDGTKLISSLDEMDGDGNPVAYRDLDDKKVIEKTSQALREGQPKLLSRLAQKQFPHATMPPYLHAATIAMGPVTVASQYNHYVLQNATPQFAVMFPLLPLPQFLSQLDAGEYEV